MSSQLPEFHNHDIQQLLLAWANISSGSRQLSPGDLREGEALCRLVLVHRPNMTGLQAALGKPDPEQRLAAFFNTVQQQLSVPALLDSPVGQKII